MFESGGLEHSACVRGEVVSHKSADSSKRYAVFDGEIYYCEDIDHIPDSYDFTQEILPGSKIYGCICNWDGLWNCTQEVTEITQIKTFWGRFKIFD